MAFAFNAIAAGYDNLEELTRWSKLGTTECPLFQGYKKFIPIEWHSFESQVLGGDRLYSKIGLPWFTLKFPLIYEEEHYKIITDFTTNGISGYVTVSAYDRDALTWKYFNAILWVLPENTVFNVEKGYYDDYKLEFRNLEEIT